MEIGDDDPRVYWPILAGTVPDERLKKQIYWHALPVGWEQLEYMTFLERRRLLIAQIVRDGFAVLTTGHDPHQSPHTVSDLLGIGESETVEFKSSARWNLKAGAPDKKMEQVIVKTVCGFLNAQGGTLLIGVDDDGAVVGLSSDYTTLGSKPNADGFELFLRQKLDSELSVPTAGIVKIRFEPVGGQEICIVSVAASGKAVFSKPLEGSQPPSEFWVRIGNATKQLHGDDMVEYQEVHWG
jgi:hypothetical protein